MSYIMSVKQAWSAKALVAVLTVSMFLSAFPVAVFVSNAATATTVFSSGFEEVPAFPMWTSADAKWQNSGSVASRHSGSRGATVNGAGTPALNSILRISTSTVGVEDVVVSFWYKTNNWENEDSVVAEWFDGTNWINFFTKTGVSATNTDAVTEWTYVSASLPSLAANSASFGLRFSATIDSGSDDFYLDDVGISGMTIDPVVPEYTELVETIVVTDDTAAGENQPGWMFGRDLSNATPFAFDDVDALIGDGALHVLPIGPTSSQKFIGEYFFLDSIADLESFAIDFKIGPAGDNSDANKVYLNVYANFGSSSVTKFYDCRYDVVATVGSTGSYTTLTFDPTVSYPVTTRSGGDPSPFTCPAVPADMDTLSSSSSVRAIAVNMGDTSISDVGLDGFFDRAIVVTTDDIEMERRTTTFDFEPTAPSCEIVIISDANDFVEEKNNNAVLTWVHPVWLQEIVGSVADWIWGDAMIVNPAVAETQTFLKKFNWTGDTLTSAVLKIASDNAHSITLGTYASSSLNEFNYSSARTYDVTSGVINGLNTLAIEVENYAASTTNPQENPAGLIYELKLTGTGEVCGEVVPVEPVANVEMCKLDADTERGLSDWTLNLFKEEVTTLSVPANNPSGVDTSVALEAGKPYVAVVSGVWLNDREPDNHVDAEFSTENNWTTYMDGFDGYGENILDLQIDESFVDWGSYNGSDHTYTYSFVPSATATVNFRVFDGNGTTVEPSWYNDNSGDLSVKIYEGYSVVTGKNGCYTIEDVPVGTYEVTELMQEGWENVSGIDEYTITDDVTITVVNRLIPETAEMVITKDVIGGTASVTDFAIMYRLVETEEWSDPINFDNEGQIVLDVPYGTYQITEVESENYTPEYSEECFSMYVTPETDMPTCNITNTYEEPLVCTPGENLLANGGFEAPVVTNLALWDTFTGGLSWLVDWVNPSSDTPSLEIQAGVNGWLAEEGIQYAELDGHAPTKITQTVPTIAGLTYTLDWAFSARPGTRQPDNQLAVYVNGDQVDSQQAGGISLTQTDWRSQGYQFIGTGEDVEISFADAGNNNSLGTFLDDVSLTCEPAPEYGPYCGDEVVNQEWEQCEVGSEGCTDYCLFANQCQDLTLVKVNLENTESPSFDNNIYLGSTGVMVPNNTWFPFVAAGDATAQSVALVRDGLAIERDQVNGTLKLAVNGDNETGFDAVNGTISIVGGEFGTLERMITPIFKLENGSEEDERPNDIWRRATSTEMEFAWRTYGSRDGASVSIITEDIPAYLCPDEDDDSDEDREVYRVEGNVWHDRNEDGEREGEEESEEFMGSWPVTATNGSTTYATTTDGSGSYYFELEAGTWTITVGDEIEWSNTNPSTGQYEITVPLVPAPVETLTSVWDSLLAFFTPATAQAATIVLETYTGYNFGLHDDNTGSSSSGGTRIRTGGGTPQVLGESTSVPQVLGDSMTIMPLGAPNTGFGGSSNQPINNLSVTIVSLLLLLGAAYGFHKNRLA